MSQAEKFSTTNHDWHSAKYVDEWIMRDILRERERRPLLEQMFSGVSIPRDRALRVLDVGGGYGAVTEQVLRAFPHAQVTLQDYSQLMLDRARQQLSNYPDRVRFILCDLQESSWTHRVVGPRIGESFDLVVSGIAIHNLREENLIAGCYRAIFEVLKPGGAFVNCDHFDNVGGIATHLRMLRDAGFEDAECTFEVPGTAIIAARRPAG